MYFHLNCYLCGMEKTCLEQNVAKYIAENKLFTKCDRILVAISGGADSVALLRVLLRLGYDCVAAHCNFHLRGEESMRDELFVRNLCAGLKCGLETVDFDVYSYMSRMRVSVEMACRDLRYEWFEKIRNRHGCTSIAVAHHQDDSIETFFLNLFRGSGVVGLSGIRCRNGAIVRPMLCVSRQDIECYLRCLQQDYVTDSTNLDTDYQRNKIRNVILPMIAEQFPHAMKGIAASIKNLLGDGAIFMEEMEKIRNDIVSTRQDGVRQIDVAGLERTGHPATVLHEILHGVGFNSSQTELIWSSIQHKKTGALFESQHYLVEFERNKLNVIPKKVLEEKSQEEVAFRVHDDVEFPIELAVDMVDYFDGFRFERNPQFAYFDDSLLEEKLVLRHWKKGDRFRPFGVCGHKKVSDFFTDKKFSLMDKQSAWLLCAGDKIIWIVGHRNTSEYKVTSQTKRIVTFRCGKNSEPAKPR